MKYRLLLLVALSLCTPVIGQKVDTYGTKMNNHSKSLITNNTIANRYSTKDKQSTLTSNHSFYNESMNANFQDFFYVKDSKVWRKKNENDPWVLAFSLPVSHYTDYSITSIGLSNISKPDTIYIALCEVDSTLSISKQQLFWSRNAADNVSDISWFNISDTNANNRARINDIEVDDNNASKIWIAYQYLSPNSYHSQQTSSSVKIGYSPNFGNTWYNVSNGLPISSVQRIICSNTNKQYLTAITDSGIYKCNFSSFNPNIAYPHNIKWIR